MIAHTVQRVRSFILRSEFAGQVFTLMAGTTFAQALTVLISPILSRLYAPEAFGLLALFTSLLGWLYPLVMGGYENSILLAKTEEEARSTFNFTAWVVLTLTAVLAFLLIIFNTPIAVALNNLSIRPWLFVLPFAILMASGYKVLNAWMLRQKQFDRIAKSQVSQSLTHSGVNVVMGLVSFLRSSGLVMGSIAGQAAGFLVLAAHSVKHDQLRLSRPNRDIFLKHARDYQDFPKFNLPLTFLDGMRENLFIFLVSSYYGSTTLGFYALGLKVLRLPISVIGSAMAQAYYQKGSQAYNANQEVWPLFRGVVLQMTALAVLGMVGLMGLGPFLFRFVFGKEWTEAGVYARLLAPWIMMSLVHTSVTYTPAIFRKQRTFLFFGLIYDLIIPGSFFVTSLLTHNIYTSFLMVGISGGVVLVATIIWFASIARPTTSKS